jgi:lysozyme family protein
MSFSLSSLAARIRAWFSGTAGVPRDRFEACLAVTFAQEGGFADDPQDSGGPTKYGVTLSTLRSFRHDPDLTVEDVRALGREEAREILRSQYWNAVRASDMPPGVDLMVFDLGVNAGPRRSVCILQSVLAVPADGAVGPVTLAALRQRDARRLVGELAQARLAFYRSLRGYPRFGRGWTRRTEAVRDAALRMM